MEAFADASTFGLDDYQYLSDKPLGVYRSTRRMPRSPRVKRRQLMLAGSTLGLLAVLLFCRLMYNTYERLGGDFDRLAERREARERAGHEVQTTTTTAAPETAPAATAPAAPASDEAAKGLVPVSATPLPDETLTADTARLAAALAVSQHAPVELPALAPAVPAAVSASATAPAVPIPGDGAAVREALTAPAVPNPAPNAGATSRPATAYRSPMFRPDDSRPQTVVNNGPARPLN